LGKINAQTAWGSATGNGVRIGIIDDGLQHSHPDLIARLRRARNHGLVREAAEFVRSDAAFDSAGAAHP